MSTQSGFGRPSCTVLAMLAVTACLTVPALGQVIILPPLRPEDGPPPEALPFPEAIIARHIEVTGGRAAYERVRNRRTTGTFRRGAQGAPSRLVVEEQAPNARRVHVDLPGGALIYVTNAQASWTYEGDVIVASSGDQRRQEIRRAAFNPLLDWQRHYELSKTLGVTEVDGRPAYEVRLTAEDCHKIHVFFDVETGREVRRTEELDYAGTVIRTDARIGAYRAFDGIELPTTMRRVVVYQGGRIVQEYEYTSIEHDVDMPPGRFETPPELAPG